MPSLYINFTNIRCVVLLPGVFVFIAFIIAYLYVCICSNTISPPNIFKSSWVLKIQYPLMQLQTIPIILPILYFIMRANTIKYKPTGDIVRGI